MATRDYTITNLPPGNGNTRCVQVTWTGLLNGDDGKVLDLGAFADRSVQVRGTLGAGGSLRAEGSNLPTTPTVSADYDTLTDPQGNALDINALKLEQISEATRWFRPRVTAGDGTTNLTVYLFAILK